MYLSYFGFIMAFINIVSRCAIHVFIHKVKQLYIWTEEVIQKALDQFCECWKYKICYLQICSSLVWEHFQHQSKVSSNRTQCIIELFCLYNIKIIKLIRVQNLFNSVSKSDIFLTKFPVWVSYKIRGPSEGFCGDCEPARGQRPVQQSRYSLCCPKFPIFQITNVCESSGCLLCWTSLW